MTNGERMVWTAAFAQAQIAGHDAPHASGLAYECVQGLRRVADNRAPGVCNQPPYEMAREVDVKPSVTTGEVIAGGHG
jgi:hypothetical protein